MPLPPSRICCRKIDNNDIDSIVNLLTKGFPGSSRDFWLRAVQRLSRHPAPVDFPKYGYLLESAGRPVGVILLIFSSTLVNGKMGIRCNVSSWYVEPGFRTYAAM